MSHDQRPARVRVVGGPAVAGAPQRRHTDPARASAASEKVATAGVAKADLAPTGAKPATAILFLLACTIGGATVVAIRLVS